MEDIWIDKRISEEFIRVFRETLRFNPHFAGLLQKMAEIHIRKAADYSKDDNQYSNFEYAAQVSGIFTNDADRVFATMIGIKMARIAELRKGKTPKNESLADSFLDLAVYAVLWGSYFSKQGSRRSETESSEMGTISSVGQSQQKAQTGTPSDPKV